MIFIILVVLLLVTYGAFKLIIKDIPIDTSPRASPSVKPVPDNSKQRFVRFNPFSGNEYMCAKRVSSFIAIDFETANELPLSICAVGIAKVIEGNVDDSDFFLVRPNEMRFTNSHIHGITASSVCNSPSFSELWEDKFRDLIANSVVVAHNANFDIGCLENYLQANNVDLPAYAVIDSLSVARHVWPHLANHKLPTVTSLLKINLKHHDAESDAIACATILLEAQTASSYIPTLKCLRFNYPNINSYRALAGFNSASTDYDDYRIHLIAIEAILKQPFIADNEMALLHRKCGEVYQRRQHLVEAADHYEKALKYNPKVGVAMALKKIKKAQTRLI